MKPDSRIEGRKKKYRHLHRLKLVARQCREGEADGQIGGDEDQQNDREQKEAADHRHLEEKARGGEHQRRLDVADHDVGHDLAEHDLQRARRHGQQIFHRAALDLSRHGERGEHHHGHGEDHADDSGDDVVLRPVLGVVARMDDEVEGRRRRDPTRERSGKIAIERRGREQAQGGDGIARGGRIGRVGVEQDLRTGAAHDIAGKIRRNFDHELDGPAPDQRLRFLARFGPFRDPEIVGVFERREKRSREDRVVLREDGGRQVLRIGVDRIAEEQELHDRHAQHHREGELVAPHLDELLADQRGEAMEVEAVSDHAKLSGACFIIRMNTSSSVGSSCRQERSRSFL